MSDKSKAERKLTGEQIGEKLLESIAEMNAGKAARATRVAQNEVAAARMKTAQLSVSPRRGTGCWQTPQTQGQGQGCIVSA